MEERLKKKKDPDGTGEPLVVAVKVQGGPQGEATCPKTDEDMEAQVSTPDPATGMEEEEVRAEGKEQAREGWRERKKKKRKEKRKGVREAKTGISPLHRRCAPELGAGSSAGERRRGEPVDRVAQAHAGGSSGGGGRAVETPSREKRKRETNSGVTPETRRRKQDTEERTYAQVAEKKWQAAIVVKGGGNLTRQEAEMVRCRLLGVADRIHKAQKAAKPMPQAKAFLRFLDAGWIPPGFLLVSCRDQYTLDWLAQWEPGEIEGRPLKVALGSSIPWPRKVCLVIKSEVEPDPEAVRDRLSFQNDVDAEEWQIQQVEEVGAPEGEDRRRNWLMTFMIPAASLALLQAQEMMVHYELLGIRVHRPRGRRGRRYLAGPREEGRTQTETGESASESESS